MLESLPGIKGYCECGCGEVTPLASQTITARGWVKGEYIRFVRGHNKGHHNGNYCPEGHEYTEENTYYTPIGGRYCRTCKFNKSRIWRNKAWYNISPEEIELLWFKQCGLCVTCGDILEECAAGNMGSHIDHDHKTNKVRGILCGKCNMGLGNFRDNPQALRIAADYLEEHNG